MDPWYTVQSYAVAIAIAGGLAYYYVGTTKQKPVRGKEKAQNKKQTADRIEEVAEAVKPAKKAPKASKGDKAASKSKAGKQSAKPSGKQPAAPEVPVEDVAHDDEAEMSAKAFAERMRKAKEGTDLSQPSKSSQQRVKTVKTGRAVASPMPSSGASQDGADADGELSPAPSPAMKAGDVSDMLEPASSGPTSLRITASEKPQKEKKQTAKKEEQVETKKQRQNRKKKEEARLLREAEEKERRNLMERSRRSAREARGEPAKNGVPIAPAPTSNPWSAQNAAGEAQVQTGSAVNGNPAPPLLDTFDAESTGSSNGAAGASTAATSTYDQDMPSEEDQMAAAVKQSEDESGWATVAKPKKQKKRGGSDAESGAATPVEAPKAKPAPVKAAAPSRMPNGEKPKGYMALQDEYTQRTDVDPNDSSNWDA